jgi:hypothetical protein
MFCCDHSIEDLGCAEGEPMVDDTVLCTDAPESDVEESTGGCCRSKDCAAELAGE